MTPAENAACQAALAAAEQAAEALRAVLNAGGVEASSEALRIKDVVADYQVSPKTARRWAQSRGYKLGGVWFICRDKLKTVAP